MSKLNSRKLWVWITGILFVGTTIYITKTVTPELINFMIFNSIFYISGNVTQKYIFRDKKE
jgi:hypothetical protein